MPTFNHLTLPQDSLEASQNMKYSRPLNTTQQEMANPRRFSLKFGPYEGLFREDPKNTGGIQLVRRRATSRQSRLHHEGTSHCRVGNKQLLTHQVALVQPAKRPSV
jgi:hypothetical protein